MSREIKNARIVSTMLGYEDHGILTCYITFDYGGAGQSFGGYTFDQYDKTKEQRVPMEYGMRFIACILKVVGVESWEKLVGQHVRVDAQHDHVFRIGNLLRNEWFDPSELPIP